MSRLTKLIGSSQNLIGKTSLFVPQTRYRSLAISLSLKGKMVYTLGGGLPQLFVLSHVVSVSINCTLNI